MTRERLRELSQSTGKSFREFIAGWTGSEFDSPMGSDHWELIDSIDRAASGSIQRAPLGRGRGATTLALAAVAWLELTGIAKLPVFVTTSNDHAESLHDLLNNSQAMSGRLFTLFRGLRSSPRGLVRREQIEVPDDGTGWKKFRNGAVIRPDFLLVDSPFRGAPHGSAAYHTERRCLEKWLQIFGPAQTPRGILINC